MAESTRGRYVSGQAEGSCDGWAMVETTAFRVGEQIRVRGLGGNWRLASAAGRVDGPDPSLRGHYIVRLDRRAVNLETGERLSRVRVAADNLEHADGGLLIVLGRMD